MKKNLLLIYIISFLLYSQLALGQYSTKSFQWNTAAYEKHTFTNSYGTMPYRLLKPRNVKAGQKYPLVIMLHGKGEGLGTDCSAEYGPNECQLLWGGKMHYDSLNKYPGYVVFPQTSGGDWVNDKPYNLLKGVIEQLFMTYSNIDLDRVYIHGLSAGGQGVWNIVYKYPQLFAAVSPHSAAGNSAYSSELVYTPIWNVQGGLDTHPTDALSTSIIDDLRKHGKQAIFTLNEVTGKQEWPQPSSTIAHANQIYTLAPTLAHEAWPALYNSPTWLAWMFSQKKNRIVVIGRTTIQPGETVKMGVTAGYDAYQWSNGATTNEIVVKSGGTYRVRYKRKKYFFSGPSEWSPWSEPVTIKVNPDAVPVADAGKDRKVKTNSGNILVRGYGAGPNVTYNWTKVSGGPVNYGASNTNTLVINSDVKDGTYTFRLTVTGGGKSASDDVIIYAGTSGPANPATDNVVATDSTAKPLSDSSARSVTGFALVNADNNQIIRAIKNGDAISTADLPAGNIDIRATTNPDTVGSVLINLDGSGRTAGTYPYTYFGAGGGTLSAGTHTLSAIPYSDGSGTQGAGNGLSITFTITQPAARVALMDDLPATDSNGVKVYPNPLADETMNLSFASGQKNVKLYVYDQTGNLVYNTEVTAFDGDEANQVQLPYLLPGIYRVRITSDKIQNKVIPIVKK